MAKNKSTSSGIGLSGFVFLVFLIFKLANIGVVAHWSWWWVTAPLWIGLAIIFFFLLIALIIKIIQLVVGEE